MALPGGAAPDEARPGSARKAGPAIRPVSASRSRAAALTVDGVRDGSRSGSGLPEPRHDVATPRLRHGAHPRQDRLRSRSCVVVEVEPLSDPGFGGIHVT